LGPVADRVVRAFACKQPDSKEVQPGRCERLVDGAAFKFLGALVICLNFVFIFAQTDFKMSNLNADEPASYFIIEMLFIAFYTFELGAQILVHRRAFFVGEDVVWNWFDFVVVTVAIVELLLEIFGFSNRKKKMSFLRVLRFLKISRVLSVFHALRIFKEIRLMVDSLMGSFPFFFWCLGMLAMFLSLFSIFFVQGLTTVLEERSDLDPSLRKAIASDFGSVSGGMISLLKAATGGNDWGDYYGIFTEMSVAYQLLYLFFILFSFMAFFNVVTSVFMEKAMHLARPNISEVMVEMKQKEIEDASELLCLLDDVSGDESRCLDTAKFEELLKNQKFFMYFELRGFNEPSVRRFFKQLLEINQTESIDFGTFASACVKLCGNASRFDVHMLSAEMKAIKMGQLRFYDDVNKLCRVMAKDTKGASTGECK
jgi:hypothetical protein